MTHLNVFVSAAQCRKCDPRVFCEPWNRQTISNCKYSNTYKMLNISITFNVVCYASIKVDCSKTDAAADAIAVDCLQPTSARFSSSAAYCNNDLRSSLSLLIQANENKTKRTHTHTHMNLVRFRCRLKVFEHQWN